MLELATSVFICGAGTDSGRKRLAEAFGLDGGLTRALERIGKPTAGGAAMAAVFKTKEGPLKRHLVHTLSPLLLWAFSSQAEDTVLRNALYERFEPSEVLRVLSDRHPGGIKREVERRRALIKEGAAPSADGRGVVGDILRELAAELQKAPGAQTGRRGMFGNF
jgi:intracellular multiplication protein IcmB